MKTRLILYITALALLTGCGELSKKKVVNTHEALMGSISESCENGLTVLFYYSRHRGGMMYKRTIDNKLIPCYY